MLIEACESGERPDAAALAMALEDRDRRLLFEIAFESGAPPTWEEAESCLDVLRRRRAEEELPSCRSKLNRLRPPPAQTPAANCGGSWSANRNSAAVLLRMI